MDSRLAIFGLLDLAIGDAHVIRNAGGLATDDAIRSLALSQHLLGTRDIIVVQHTRCGLHSTTDEDFLALLPETPPWTPGAFTDLEANLRSTVEALRSSPFLPHTRSVRGTIYDVDTGELRDVVTL